MLRKSLKNKRQHFKSHYLLYIFVLIFFGGVGFLQPSVHIDINRRLSDFEIELSKYRQIVIMENEKAILVKRINNIIIKRHFSNDQLNRLSHLIFDLSKMYQNLSVQLICVTIKQESGWHPSAISEKGAIGLMQIMPSTGAWLAKLEGMPSLAIRDLFDPFINIRLGCRYLSMLIDQYHDIALALAHYNGGSTQARFFNLGDSLICEETKKYVSVILAQMQLNRDYYDLAN